MLNAPPADLIRLVTISKRFGTVQALDGASLTLRRGEVHVILGENGAGKTSLMNILAGLYRADSGEIWVDRLPVDIHSPRDALRHGITMVHQHFQLLPNLTVLENIILGHEGGHWTLRRPAQLTLIQQLMAQYNLDLPLDQPVRELSVGLQQKVEIVKALYRQTRLLILDEPTTFLTPQEVVALFNVLRGLVTQGVTLVLITHKIRDALSIGDRLTVMRRGRVVSTTPVAEASEAGIIAHLMGSTAITPQDVSPEAAAPLGLDLHTGQATIDAPPPTSQPLLEASSLSLASSAAQGGASRAALTNVSFTLHAGEILGVAGVAGNGQDELVSVLVGAHPATGRVRLRGQEISGWTIKQRIQANLALIPGDRIHDGILPNASVYESLILGLHQLQYPDWRYAPEVARHLAQAAIQSYEIKTPSDETTTAVLSGGNIQKVIVARAMHICAAGQQPVLIAVNPTRGLDINTTRLVHDQIRQVAAQGGGVLLVSEDLDELMALSHRLVVLYRGTLGGEFRRADFDRYAIGEAMVGLQAAPPPAGIN